MQNCFCVTKLAILTINAKEFLNFFRNPAEKKQQFRKPKRRTEELPWQIEHFERFDAAFLQLEAKCRADNLPALDACRTRIHVQKAPLGSSRRSSSLNSATCSTRTRDRSSAAGTRARPSSRSAAGIPTRRSARTYSASTPIPRDLKDMAVTAHKEVRLAGPQELGGPGIIVAGTAADVSHQHAHSFLAEHLILREFLTDVEAVAIAVDAQHRLAEVADLLHEAKAAAPVPGVPDDIDRGQEIGKLLGENAVRIGQKAYEHSI